ncbi:MAG: OsmC family peroxiredoxin [Thermoleophilia bacterium]|nr:OsmC family peroxiredoxin [Thermoleophilia bacterium]
MPQTSTGRARWNGSLAEGSGVTSTASPALAEQPITWKARIGDAAGTTPEELIAAAWAGCYSMALSGALSGAGFEPTQLDVEVDVSFGPEEGGGFAISSATIRVSAAVPGIDATAFGEAAEGAKVGCPVSKAFANNVPVSLDATLAG